MSGRSATRTSIPTSFVQMLTKTPLRRETRAVPYHYGRGDVRGYIRSVAVAADFGKGLRILVVDDEEVIGKVLALMLRPVGFEVEVVLDIASAKAAVAARAPDLVISDKNLPDGSGLDLIRDLVARKVDCEIMMITGYGSEESAFEAVSLGIADYLSKPFADIATVREHVRRVIDRLLERRRLESVAKSATPPTSEPRRRLRFNVELTCRFVLVDGRLSSPAFVTSL